MSALVLGSAWFPNVDAAKGQEIAAATLDTLIMLAASLPLSLLIGLPLGVLMFLTGKGRPQSRPWLYNSLAFVVNILRSVPFIILMISLIPITLAVMGTSLGVRGAILPLVVGAAPFFARLAEASLREVDRGVVEAATAMGATTWQLITRVLLPEARPGLISAATITAIALVGFTAMGGAIGSGGLGDLAYRDGYQRSQTDVAVVTVALLLVLVQLIQMLGDRLTAHFTRR
ncbi:methionine ABC transporter permease [Pseudoxanthomonas composti]|uniref:ABC transporter permease n=1 Tax=Pseudoxanthomonas composti TaxID=2137479 RepID=A0A4Q1JZ84_9GAMM|nr:methionine ABC transporter permease [Pseudoxanthomonas composti]RXR07382.1 ABC transporter permease [Pseudoxanthomonas composti]